MTVFQWVVDADAVFTTNIKTVVPAQAGIHAEFAIVLQITIPHTGHGYWTAPV